MRLKAFAVEKIGPIRRVEVGDLADVVVLAGPNGVGKTNVLSALLDHARNSRHGPVWMIVEATSPAESNRWKKKTLDTRKPEDVALLQGQLRRNQRRNAYEGSFLNFDSDRAVRNVQSFTFSWDISNPFNEEVGWDVGFSQLHNRYNDVRHSLFRLVESQRREIADQAIRLRAAGNSNMELNFPDVLREFKDAFRQLLAPKELIEVNVKEQQIYYGLEGQRLALDTLSSGEKEVVNIVFDFLLRAPKDCVIVFDEPELHLHPELSYKLLQALARVGERNQFIFSTHSPEIISASLENSVLFVTPPKGDDNQAIAVHRDDETHHALQALGQSIGVISLGKRLVLIEGGDSSLDKQTYGAILKGAFPEFVLVPVGGKDTVRSFDDVKDNVLNKAIWGVEFFMLCDGDARPGAPPEALTSNRIRVLPRYHLENYFLDEDVLAAVFRPMEAGDSWLVDPAKIRAKIAEIAKTVIPYAVALDVSAAVRQAAGNVSIMPKGLTGDMNAAQVGDALKVKASTERGRVQSGLEDAVIGKLVQERFGRIEAALSTDDPSWRTYIPGKIVFNKFAAAAGMQSGRLKQLYLANADLPVVFKDVMEIFEAFRAAG